MSYASFFIVDYVNFVVLVLCLLLMFLILFRSKKQSSIIFSAFLAATVIWIGTNILADISLDYGEALMWARATIIGPIFMPILLLLFSFTFPEGGTIKRGQYLYLLVPFLFAPFIFSGANISTVRIVAGRTAEASAGWLYVPFLVYFFLLLAFVIYRYVIKYLSAESRNKKQIAAVVISTSVSVVMSLLFNAVLFVTGDASLVSWGPVTPIVMVIGIAYSILRHQLFDIRVVVKKIFLYTLLLGFVFGVYSIVIQALSAWLPLPRSVADFAAALLVAFSFDPVRRAIARWTERYLFVSEYKADEVIKGLTDQLAGVVDLDEALRLVVRHITDGMGLERGAAIVKRAADNGEIQLHVGANAGVPAPTRLIEEAMLPIFELLGGTQEAVMTGQLRQQVDSDSLTPSAIRRFVFRGGRAPNHHLARLRRQTLEQLDRLKLGAAVPVVVNKKPICILLFGDKQSGDIYFTEDVKFLQLVASTTANAIEKARFYEEDQIKSEFVSIASHELLTPTAAIEGYLSMILVEKMGKVDKQAEQYLQVVYKSAQRLATLVKDLLAMSRIEGNRIQIVPKYFDLGALVKEQVMTIMPRAGEKSLKLSIKTLPKGELKSYADPEKVTQVFINLVSNAIKYTKKGSVTVNVFDKGSHWEISVSDTGIGMAPADRQHLFEKFYRIQNDNTMGITGTGLGLYISKSLITMMGGDITVSSELGKGSTFAFTVAKKPNQAT